LTTKIARGCLSKRGGQSDLSEVWVDCDAVVEDEAVAAPVRPAALFEVAQDAPLELVHLLEAPVHEHRRGLLAPHAAGAVGHHGKLLKFISTQAAARVSALVWPCCSGAACCRTFALQQGLDSRWEFSEVVKLQFDGLFEGPQAHLRHRKTDT